MQHVSLQSFYNCKFPFLLQTNSIYIILNIVFRIGGFLLIAFEAPFVCFFIEHIDRINAFSQARLHWQKAALYCGMGAIPIFICPEFNTIIGGGMIFACGIIQGFLALGWK